ncbi:MAG: hypothetical protein ACRD4V_01210 [Candidatus Acidiferrales bacterium]
MAEKQREITPSTILFIGGGIFVLLFGLCAGSGQLYYVHDADKAINALFGIALTNIVVALVTVATAIIVSVRRHKRSLSEDATKSRNVNYGSRWTSPKDDER